MATLLWDQHTCLPLQVGTPVDPLTRYAAGGGVLLSVNAGYSPQTFPATVALLESFRSRITAHPDLELAENIDDVAAITGAGRIAVVFDLEDANPVGDDLANVATLAGLGVRTLQPTYNHANRAGSGCLDAHDGGLTDWGRAIVAELNRAGIVPDGSHGSVRTGLDLCAVSAGPVIYSHSCMAALWAHPRNITDAQARACAATGGVVGITGVGIFLGDNTPTLAAMTAHLEYAVELIGIEHVGVSTDHSFDHADFNAEMAANPGAFDDSYTRYGPIRWMAPETWLGLGAHLRARDWAEADVAAVLGGNFARVARQCWK